MKNNIEASAQQANEQHNDKKHYDKESYDQTSYDSSGLVKALWIFPPLRRRYVAWVNRILPRVEQITLDSKRVFVFPTLRGLGFVVSAFCVFLAGTNYSNNLILGLGFLLFSIFVVGIWQCFLNILGLTITAGSSEPIFLGEFAHFKVGLRRPSEKPIFAINVSWPESSDVLTNLENESQTTVVVQIKPKKRGYFYPPRLSVETRFPFGTIRCWSHLALATHSIVYPQPIKNDVFVGEGHDGIYGEEINHHGNEEFYELKKYEDGDNLNRISWKSYSKGQGLMTKQFVSFKDEAIWLNWLNFREYHHELKISYLCYWVLKFTEQNRPFGLDIPGVTIEPDLGVLHLQSCLHALATFDVDLVKEQSNPESPEFKRSKAESISSELTDDGGVFTNKEFTSKVFSATAMQKDKAHQEPEAENL